MAHIPTAEEFYTAFCNKRTTVGPLNGNERLQIMIEFAKLHVEEALKEALESIPCLGSSTDIATYEEVEKAVLNAYPLTKIK